MSGEAVRAGFQASAETLNLAAAGLGWAGRRAASKPKPEVPCQQLDAKPAEGGAWHSCSSWGIHCPPDTAASALRVQTFCLAGLEEEQFYTLSAICCTPALYLDTATYSNSNCTALSPCPKVPPPPSFLAPQGSALGGSALTTSTPCPTPPLHLAKGC